MEQCRCEVSLALGGIALALLKVLRVIVGVLKVFTVPSALARGEVGIDAAVFKTDGRDRKAGFEAEVRYGKMSRNGAVDSLRPEALVGIVERPSVIS